MALIWIFTCLWHLAAIVPVASADLTPRGVQNSITSLNTRLIRQSPLYEFLEAITASSAGTPSSPPRLILLAEFATTLTITSDDNKTSSSVVKMNNISKRKITARSLSPDPRHLISAPTARSLPLKKASGAELSTLPLPFSSELESEKTFPFLKLPPELREMVYEYILVPANVIVNHPAYWPGSRRPLKIFTTRNNTVSGRRRGQPFLGKNEVTILLVSRLIYKEALPIVYGKNDFILTTAHVVKPFLAKLRTKTLTAAQPGFERIRHVTVSGLSRRSLGAAARSLRELTKLKTLTFEVFDQDSPDAMAGAALRFIDLRSEHSTRKAQFDKIFFVCNEDPQAMYHGRPLFTELGPARCKARLAELANLLLKD